jgi:soluble lytic murein transglycosylase-like protein
MDSDYPEFDKAYLKLMLPENPNQFDLLAARANFGIYRHDLWQGTGRRFAESIVKECMSVVQNAVDHREPASTYADKIRERFGIDE